MDKGIHLKLNSMGAPARSRRRGEVSCSQQWVGIRVFSQSALLLTVILAAAFLPVLFVICAMAQSMIDISCTEGPLPNEIVDSFYAVYASAGIAGNCTVRDGAMFFGVSDITAASCPSIADPLDPQPISAPITYGVINSRLEEAVVYVSRGLTTGGMMPIGADSLVGGRAVPSEAHFMYYVRCRTAIVVANNVFASTDEGASVVQVYDVILPMGSSITIANNTITRRVDTLAAIKALLCIVFQNIHITGGGIVPWFVTVPPYTTLSQMNQLYLSRYLVAHDGHRSPPRSSITVTNNTLSERVRRLSATTAPFFGYDSVRASVVNFTCARNTIQRDWEGSNSTGLGNDPFSSSLFLMTNGFMNNTWATFSDNIYNMSFVSSVNSAEQTFVAAGLAVHTATFRNATFFAVERNDWTLRVADCRTKTYTRHVVHTNTDMAEAAVMLVANNNFSFAAARLSIGEVQMIYFAGVMASGRGAIGAYMTEAEGVAAAAQLSADNGGLGPFTIFDRRADHGAVPSVGGDNEGGGIFVVNNTLAAALSDASSSSTSGAATVHGIVLQYSTFDRFTAILIAGNNVTMNVAATNYTAMAMVTLDTVVTQREGATMLPSTLYMINNSMAYRVATSVFCTYSGVTVAVTLALDGMEWVPFNVTNRGSTLTMSNHPRRVLFPRLDYAPLRAVGGIANCTFTATALANPFATNQSSNGRLHYITERGVINYTLRSRYLWGCSVVFFTDSNSGGASAVGQGGRVVWRGMHARFLATGDLFAAVDEDVAPYSLSNTAGGIRPSFTYVCGLALGRLKVYVGGSLEIGPANNISLRYTDTLVQGASVLSAGGTGDTAALRNEPHPMLGLFMPGTNASSSPAGSSMFLIFDNTFDYSEEDNDRSDALVSVNKQSTISDGGVRRHGISFFGLKMGGAPSSIAVGPAELIIYGNRFTTVTANCTASLWDYEQSTHLVFAAALYVSQLNIAGNSSRLSIANNTLRTTFVRTKHNKEIVTLAKLLDLPLIRTLSVCFEGPTVVAQNASLIIANNTIIMSLPVSTAELISVEVDKVHLAISAMSVAGVVSIGFYTKLTIESFGALVIHDNTLVEEANMSPEAPQYARDAYAAGFGELLVPVVWRLTKLTVYGSDADSLQCQATLIAFEEVKVSNGVLAITRLTVFLSEMLYYASVIAFTGRFHTAEEVAVEESAALTVEKGGAILIYGFAVNGRFRQIVLIEPHTRVSIWSTLDLTLSEGSVFHVGCGDALGRGRREWYWRREFFATPRSSVVHSPAGPLRLPLCAPLAPVSIPIDGGDGVGRVVTAAMLENATSSVGDGRGRGGGFVTSAWQMPIVGESYRIADAATAILTVRGGYLLVNNRRKAGDGPMARMVGGVVVTPSTAAPQLAVVGVAVNRYVSSASIARSSFALAGTSTQSMTGEPIRISSLTVTPIYFNQTMSEFLGISDRVHSALGQRELDAAIGLSRGEVKAGADGRQRVRSELVDYHAGGGGSSSSAPIGEVIGAASVLIANISVVLSSEGVRNGSRSLAIPTRPMVGRPRFLAGFANMVDSYCTFAENAQLVIKDTVLVCEDCALNALTVSYVSASVSAHIDTVGPEEQDEDGVYQLAGAVQVAHNKIVTGSGETQSALNAMTSPVPAVTWPSISTSNGFHLPLQAVAFVEDARAEIDEDMFYEGLFRVCNNVIQTSVVVGDPLHPFASILSPQRVVPDNVFLESSADGYLLVDSASCYDSSESFSASMTQTLSVTDLPTDATLASTHSASLERTPTLYPTLSSLATASNALTRTHPPPPTFPTSRTATVTSIVPASASASLSAGGGNTVTKSAARRRSATGGLSLAGASGTLIQRIPHSPSDSIGAPPQTRSYSAAAELSSASASVNFPSTMSLSAPAIGASPSAEPSAWPAHASGSRTVEVEMLAPLETNLPPIAKAKEDAERALTAVLLAGGGLSSASTGGQTSVAMAMLRVSQCLVDGNGASNTANIGRGGGAGGMSHRDETSVDDDDDDDDGDDDAEPLSPFIHPLQFAVGSGPYRYYNGAIIGNCVVIPLAALVLLRGPLVWVLQRWGLPDGPSTAEVLTYIGWPSILVLPYITLAEGTAASVTELLASGGALESILGLLGACSLLALIVTWGRTLRRVWGLPIARAKAPFEGYLWWPFLSLYDWAPVGDPDVTDASEPSAAAASRDDGSPPPPPSGAAIHVVDVEVALERSAHIIGGKALLIADGASLLCAIAVGIIEGSSDQWLDCHSSVTVLTVFAVMQSFFECTTMAPSEFVVQLLIGVCVTLIALSAVIDSYNGEGQGVFSPEEADALGFAVNILGFFGMALGVICGILRLIRNRPVFGALRHVARHVGRAVTMRAIRLRQSELRRKQEGPQQEGRGSATAFLSRGDDVEMGLLEPKGLGGGADGQCSGGDRLGVVLAAVSAGVPHLDEDGGVRVGPNSPSPNYPKNDGMEVFMMAIHKSVRRQQQRRERERRNRERKDVRHRASVRGAPPPHPSSSGLPAAAAVLIGDVPMGEQAPMGDCGFSPLLPLPSTSGAAPPVESSGSAVRTGDVKCTVRAVVATTSPLLHHDGPKAPPKARRHRPQLLLTEELLFISSSSSASSSHGEDVLPPALLGFSTEDSDSDAADEDAVVMGVARPLVVVGPAAVPLSDFEDI